MRKRSARHYAFVGLLLMIAACGALRHGSASAAAQRIQTIQVYVPVVHIRSDAATTDLDIVHLGLYQSVQNNSNDVSLVAGKAALLRVFAQAEDNGAPPTVAEVTVRAFRGDKLIGELNLGPRAVSSAPSGAELHSTFNFDLPAEWLRGELRLTATIDKANTVAETNEANNTVSHIFTFREVSPLDLTIVPIRYTDLQTGVTYAEGMHDPVSDWLLAVYPLNTVNVAYHTPYDFSGNLRQASEWQRLLQELTTLWAAEVGFGSPELFFGLIPINAPGASTWFGGGISGMGWIGQRVSVAVDFGPETGALAGHEIGHNFGRQHAPCGNPTNVDPDYPYPDGSIGVFGVDVAEDALLDPHSVRDMMSYCGPEWVSDYTYEALFDDQMLRSSQTAVLDERLLLRATLGDAGATFLPSYSFVQAAFPAQLNAEYEIEVISQSGEVAARYPAHLLAADETNVSARMLVASIPVGDLPEDSTFRLLHGAEIIAEQTWQTTEKRDLAPVSVVAETTRDTSVSLVWDEPEVPALVRVSSDGGQSWRVMAFDYLGGTLSIPREFLVEHSTLVEVVLANGQGSQTLQLR